MASAQLERRKKTNRKSLHGADVQERGLESGDVFLCCSPFLAVLHGRMDRVTVASENVTLAPASQQSLDRLRTSQTAGHVERRFPRQVEVVHPGTQTTTQDLKTTVRSTTVQRLKGLK